MNLLNNKKNFRYIISYIFSFVYVLLTINTSIVYAADACKKCKELQNKYGFLIPENYILNNVEGSIVDNGNINPPLDIIFLVSFVISIASMIWGIYLLLKKQETKRGKLILMIGIIVLLFSLWTLLNLNYFLECSYSACDIRGIQ